MPNKLLGAAADYLQGKYGGDLTDYSSTVGIYDHAKEVIGHDPDRLMIAIVNMSPRNAYIAFDATITTDSGILLSPYGGSVVLDVNEDGMLPTSQIFSISTQASVSTVLFYTYIKLFAKDSKG